MISFQSAINKLDDRLNPIVVKESRQSMQNNMITGVLFLFLVVLIAIMGFSVLSSSIVHHTSGMGSLTLGRKIFQGIFGLVIYLTMVFLPLHTGSRLSKEHDVDSIDLLFVSTLSPWAIARGKLYSASLMAMQVFCIALPFFFVTYLLRGIDIPSMVVVCIGGFIAVVAAIQVMLFLSSIAMSKAFRSLVNLGAFFGLSFCAAGVMGLASEGILSGIGSQLQSSSFWMSSVMMLTPAVLGIGLLHVATVGLISPPSNNKAMPLRLYLFASFVLMTIPFALAYYDRPNEDIINAWWATSILILTIKVVFVISERDELSLRIRRTIPKSQVKRWFIFVFYTGNINGLLYCLFFAVLNTMIASKVFSVFEKQVFFAQSGSDGRMIASLSSFFMYMMGFSVSALFIRRTLLKRWLKPHFTWALVLILVASTMLFHVCYSLLMDAPLLILNLLELFSRHRDSFFHYSSSGMFCLGSFFFIGNFIIRALRDFKPPVQSTVTND